MRHLRIAALLVLTGAVSTAAGDDGATPAADPAPATTTPPPPTHPVERVPPATWTVEHVLALPASVSTSLGGPNDGRLEGAVALPARGPGFVHNPRRPNADARWGTVEMVQALVRAAAESHRAMPGPELRINDLGLQHGGEIVHHGSHETGRDVDVLFHMLDEANQPVAPKCVPVDPQGNGCDFGDLQDPADDVTMRLDARRTWRFVQALIAGDRHRDIQRIFVAEHVRTLLLAEAERQQAPARTIQRFGQITCQPGTPHDDHLHIRWFCSPEDIRRGCQDGAPMYPWRLAHLQRHGVEPVIADMRAARRNAARQAAANAAPTPPRPRYHERVEAFLLARQAWSRPQRPGRPFCR